MALLVRGLAAQCAADNCYRAVLGARNCESSISSHLQDCTKALACTSTPRATSTITATITPPCQTNYYTVTLTPTVYKSTVRETPANSTQTVIVTPSGGTYTIVVTPTPVTVTQIASDVDIGATAGALIPRDIPTTLFPDTTTSCVDCPTTASIPAYAKACTGFAAFSSVCSCGGYKPTTIIGPTLTDTVTTTKTLAPTTTYVRVEITPNPTTMNITETLPARTQTITKTLPPLIDTIFVTLPASTKTIVVQPSEPTLSCDNAGLRWYWYYTPKNNGNTQIEVIKQQTPYTQGNTTYLYWQQPMYDSGQLLPENFLVLEHRGYLFTPEEGQYTFTSRSIDDFTYLWVGDKAANGWTGANRDQFGSYPASIAVTRISFKKGVYVPLRIIFGQYYGGIHFQHEITSPSGKTLIGDNSQNAQKSPYIVQASCDRKYPPLGRG